MGGRVPSEHLVAARALGDRDLRRDAAALRLRARDALVLDLARARVERQRRLGRRLGPLRRPCQSAAMTLRRGDAFSLAGLFAGLLRFGDFFGDFAGEKGPAAGGTTGPASA